MEKWIEAMLNNSILMSFVILLLLLLSSIFKNRSAKWRYYTWLIVVVGLLIPFRPPISLAPVHLKAPIQFETQNEPSVIGTEYMQHSLLENEVTDKESTTFENSYEPILPEKKSFSVYWPVIVGAVWGLGFIITVLYYIFNHIRYIKSINRWMQPIEDTQTYELLDKIKGELGIRNNLEIRNCKLITTPMLIGLIKPKILLPQNTFEYDETELILKHELIHYKRKDLWYKAMALFTNAVHWFNPFAYLMVEAISADCETSCDEEVLKGKDLQSRVVYGETIIGIVKNCSETSTVFSTGFRGGRKNMERRLSSIMNTTKKKVSVATMCIILVCTIMVGFVSAMPRQEVTVPTELVLTASVSTESASIIPEPTISTPIVQTQEPEIDASLPPNTQMAVVDNNKSSSYKTNPIRINSIGIKYDDTPYHWPYTSISITNISDKSVMNYEIACLAYDKNGNPLELYWDARNVDANGGYGNVGFAENGVDYGIVTDIHPISPKSYLHIYQHYEIKGNPPEDLAKSLEEQFGKAWVDNWIMEWRESEKESVREDVVKSMQEDEIYNLFFDGWSQSTGEHLVEYIIYCVKSVTFVDDSQWINEEYDSWLANYQGKAVSTDILSNYSKQ